MGARYQSGGSVGRARRTGDRAGRKQKSFCRTPPMPLFQEVRELVLRKCTPEKQQEIRAIFEKQAFGELERLVTQKLLDVSKRVAREELNSKTWLQSVARLSGRSYKQMRVMILEFLDTDVFHVSLENCVSFLDPLIDSWDIDLSTFGMQIVLNRRLAPRHSKRFEFVETEPDQPVGGEPGLNGFLQDASLSGNITQERSEERRVGKECRSRWSPYH